MGYSKENCKKVGKSPQSMLHWGGWFVTNCKFAGRGYTKVGRSDIIGGVKEVSKKNVKEEMVNVNGCI